MGKSKEGMPDVVIPIVFPDYMIAVETPATTIEIPDFLPFVDILPDTVRIPASKNKVGELGHAGVLFVNGKTGMTKYFEYGRYDKASLGLTRRVPVPDAVTLSREQFRLTLLRVLKTISTKAGQRGRISGAYIEVENKYVAMLKAANDRIQQNRNGARKPYALASNSCLHFMKEVLEAAGVDTPILIDPRPTSYIEEIRDDHRSLDFDPGNGRLVIEP